MRAARTMAGISARELDRRAGRAVGHASLIERGTRPRVRGDIVAAYARALGVDVGWLLTGVGTPPEPGEVRSAATAARSAP